MIDKMLNGVLLVMRLDSSQSALAGFASPELGRRRGRVIAPNPNLMVYGGGVVSMDLATQAVTTINSGEMLSLALKNLADVAAQKVAFPSEVAMAKDMPVP